MSTPAPLRVALAGLGSMGRNHLRVISTHAETRLVAVGDPDPAMLAAATGQTGAAGWSDPLAMVHEAAIDALVVAAPTTAHVPLALAAIERGIPVLVEKPLAATPAEALGIVARGAGPRRPGPGRPRRALQPGRPGARAAPPRGLADHGLLHRQPARGPVSRPASATSA